MPLADLTYFTREHIDAQRFGTSPILAEQAVHSLELVAELAAAGLSYQFKGGSSLLLILDTPKRFSIDVDIASDETRERIEECVASLPGAHGTFTRWEPRRHKTKPWLPISSYYLFYHSHFEPSGEGSIMLDVQLRRSPYKTRFVPVACGALYTSRQTVELPFAASIAGDKLLTMGPFTLGIPLGKGKQAQRLKHVYDVSCLMATGPDLNDIRDSFNGCLGHENDLQNKTVTPREVMLDTVSFCATVATHPAIPALESITDPVLKENAEGLADFAAHLFEKGYGWSDLQLDAARAAFCIAAAAASVSPERFQSVLRGDAVPENVPASLDTRLRTNEPGRYYWRHVAAAIGADPLGAS